MFNRFSFKRVFTSDFILSETKYILSIKVACVVIMQNPIQTFRQSSVAFEKPGILF